MALLQNTQVKDWESMERLELKGDFGEYLVLIEKYVEHGRNIIHNEQIIVIDSFDSTEYLN